MTILQIITAVEAAHQRSVSRAAKKLKQSQSNTSTIIQALENELGIKIFKRTASGVEPTEKGYLFLDYAERLLSNMEQMRTVKDTDAVVLRIGGARYSPAVEAFLAFCHEMPAGRKGDLQCVNIPPKALNTLSERKVDVIVVPLPDSYVNNFEETCKASGLSAIPICDVPLCIRFRKGHPLDLSGAFAGEDQDLSVLKDYPFVDYTDMETLFGTLRHEDYPEFSYLYRIAVEDREARFKTLALTDAFSVSCFADPKVEEELNLTGYPLKGKVHHVYCFVRDGEENRPEIAEYIRLLREQYEPSE